jgi:hypothetical protein
MYDPPRQPLWEVHTPWHKALDLPGAGQMRYLKALMLSRPFLTRIPDQRVIRSDLNWGLGYVQATRDGTVGKSDSTYVMVYFPQHQKVLLDVGKIAAKTLRGWWFNPRDGQAGQPREFANAGMMEFQPPTAVEGEDWVLVVDDAGKDYPAPGGQRG